MKNLSLVSLVSMALERVIWLQLVKINQLPVMNNFYKNKYCGMWTHPGTKVCHMIDFEDLSHSVGVWKHPVP